MTPDTKNTTATVLDGMIVSELVIDALVLGESELRARVADLEADVVAYRELTQAAIAALADLTKKHERMQANYYALLDERRRERTPARRAA